MALPFGKVARYDVGRCSCKYMHNYLPYLLSLGTKGTPPPKKIRVTVPQVFETDCEPVLLYIEDARKNKPVHILNRP